MVNNTVSILRAFALAATVVFDVYSQWRDEANQDDRDITYPAQEAEGAVQGALPCEPLVCLLLEGQGVDIEILLAQVPPFPCFLFASLLWLLKKAVAFVDFRQRVQTARTSPACLSSA